MIASCVLSNRRMYHKFNIVGGCRRRGCRRVVYSAKAGSSEEPEGWITSVECLRAPSGWCSRFGAAAVAGGAEAAAGGGGRGRGGKRGRRRWREHKRDQIVPLRQRSRARRDLGGWRRHQGQRGPSHPHHTLPLWRPQVRERANVVQHSRSGAPCARRACARSTIR